MRKALDRLGAVGEAQKARRRRVAGSQSLVATPYVLVALVLGFVVPRLRHGLFGWVNPDLRESQVTTFLSSVSAGMMSFTGIVFSLLFVMLQFSSAEYSPHLLPMLARDRTLTHAGGVFTGTFLYSLMALRGVGVGEGGGTPALILWVAFGWLLASVYLLLRLVVVFSGLAITDVLEKVGDLGWDEFDRTYAPYHPDGDPAARAPRDRRPPSTAPTQTVLYAGKPRYLAQIDVPRLLMLAVASDAVIRVPVAVGDALTSGVPLVVVHGGHEQVPEHELRRALVLGRDRTFEDGPKQAIRLLVDIGIHALSAAINDPTTAVHALDQIEALLLRLGNADLDIGTVCDAHGTLRVVYPAPTWDDYLDLGLTELLQYGAGAVQVERRIGALLAHVREQVPEERRAALDRIAAEQREEMKEAILEPTRRRLAEVGDRQGIGHSNGNVRFTP